MLSEMCKEDIAYLTGQGVTLSPAQIIRLNDLALATEFGSESSLFIHAPRVAWAGSTAIFEPSIQLHVWFRDFASVWWATPQSLNLASAWACAHSNRKGWFSQWTDEAATRKAIEAWQRTLDCTPAQLDNAVNYAVNGTPKEAADGSQDEAQIPDGCPYADIIADSIAAGLGVSVAELETQPRRMLKETLKRWMKNKVALAGGKVDSVDAAAATLAYCAYDDYLQSLTPEKDALHNG